MFKLLMTLVAAVSIVAVQTSCGPGKNGRRQRVSKNGGELFKGERPGPGGETGKKLEDKLQAIANDVEAMKVGSSLPVTDLPAGTYSLEKVTTSYFLSADEGFRTWNESSLQGDQLVASGTAQIAGVLENHSDNGQSINIPLSFKIDGGRLSDPSTTTLFNQSLLDKVIDDLRNDANGISVPSLLASQAVNVPNAKIYFHIYKVSDAKFRLHLLIEDKFAGDQATQYRNVFLDYNFAVASSP